jgi:hypothetical protein
LVRLLHCADCDSPYHGDANAGQRRVRHTRRPHCGRFASFRPELVEEQVARVIDGVRLGDDDLDQVFRAMRREAAAPVVPDPGVLRSARSELQRRLSEGEIGLPAFNRDWRALDRPRAAIETTPDADRLRRAIDVLADFGSLWRDVAVPDVLREGAATEIFERLEVRGSDLVAVHSRPNENAWLLGYAYREKLELVGARGLGPSLSKYLSGSNRAPCPVRPPAAHEVVHSCQSEGSRGSSGRPVELLYSRPIEVAHRGSHRPDEFRGRLSVCAIASRKVQLGLGRGPEAV